jgi:protein-tyrosine phosphatase
MRKIYDELFVGSAGDCVEGTSELAVVHACKFPCHVAAVGSKQLPKNHEHYLAKEDEYNLWLNLIDPPVPLFRLDSFHIFLNFMRKQRQKQVPVLIHCNQGHSRAPSLAMIFLAKVLLVIPDDSYSAAKKAYYERYDPQFFFSGLGIKTFLTTNWSKIY